MSLQEQVNQAIKKFEKIASEHIFGFHGALSFKSYEIDSFTVKTEIYANDTILSTGYYRDIGKINNNTYLHSILNTISNYDLTLISKE